jgi:hypothetical protein
VSVDPAQLEPGQEAVVVIESVGQGLNQLIVLDFQLAGGQAS